MHRLLLYSSVLQLVRCSCPPGFELVASGQCRRWLGVQNAAVTGVSDTSIQKCKEWDAYPPIIHNKEEDHYWRARLNSTKTRMIIGMECDFPAMKWRWSDGSQTDYQPAETIGNLFKGPCQKGRSVYLSTEGWGDIGGTVWDDFAFGCTKQLPPLPISSETPIPACQSGPWKEGQIITSPGFPLDASTPCDYVFSVVKGKNVQLEIQILEANTCCDNLMLFDDIVGGHAIANLTGEILDRTYTTKSSNIMRVSWKPNGGFGVRGLQMTFRAVDTVPSSLSISTVSRLFSRTRCQEFSSLESRVTNQFLVNRMCSPPTQ